MKKSPLFAIILACTLALPIATNADKLPVLETKVKTVAAFKNGLAFVFRTGNATPSDGWVYMNELPPAALGTLWFGTTNPLECVEEVVAYRKTEDNGRDAQSIEELLELNVGKDASLLFKTNEGINPGHVIGKILSVGEHVVIIQNPNGQSKTAIDKGNITSLTISGDSVTKSKLTKDSSKLKVSGSAKSTEITMAYLEKGITWSPSYLINISDAKMANITLGAVLLNDAEDIEDATVSFVVGYPNFISANILNPMSLQQSVASFIQALGQGQSIESVAKRGKFDFSVMANAAADSYGWQPDINNAGMQPMEGESNEDLYLYKRPNVTLKKGERAQYTIFSCKVPYEHLYELNSSDTMSIDYYGIRTGQVRDNQQQVWHVLRLENNTLQPWTTAYALAVNGSMPVAQDILKYTPSKGKTTLKLTVATDISTTSDQDEVSREQVEIRDSVFDKITVAGKLTVHNYKSNQVKLTIHKDVVGEVTKSSDGASVKKSAAMINAVNPNSQITWELELAPGAEKVVTYSYVVLLRR